MNTNWEHALLAPRRASSTCKKGMFSDEEGRSLERWKAWTWWERDENSLHIRLVVLTWRGWEGFFLVLGERRWEERHHLQSTFNSFVIDKGFGGRRGASTEVLVLARRIRKLLLFYNKDDIRATCIFLLIKGKVDFFQRVIIERIEIVVHSWFNECEGPFHLPWLFHVLGVNKNKGSVLKPSCKPTLLSA